MESTNEKKLVWAFVKYVDCPVIILSPDHTIDDINELALEIYGWERSEVLGENFSILLKKEQIKNPVPSNFSFRMNNNFRRTVQIIHKRKKKITIEWKICPIFDAANVPCAILLTGHDITERRRLEDKIYELDSIVAQMPGNVYWYDKNDNYLGCNANSAKTLGMSREKAIGKNFSMLMRRVKGISEESIDQWVQDGLDVMQTKIPKLNIEEAPFIGPDKAVVYMISNKVPLFNRKGELYGVLGISTDITNRKQMEEDLRKAKEQAEAANKAKTDFLANMSHDVKTPLSGIIAISELLRSRVQEEYKNLALDIMQAGRNLMTFFENCIELSKLENGSVASSKENFSLKHLLNEILRLYQPAIKSKGLKMYVRYSDIIPKHLFGNRIYLYRILLNLMGNAIKFTLKGSITVSAQLRKKATNKKVVVDLSIKDTGIGIAKDKQGTIFEQFSRITPSYEGVYEGSGIGLYIVQKFVKEMGGEIHIKSDEAKGSQFTVSVPLEIENKVDFTPSSQSEQVTISEESSRSRYLLKKIKCVQYSVLLVEDNFIAQKSTQILLNSLGCRVDIASNGREAIAMFKPGKYHIIFMDIGLPDIKGYQMAKRFREIEKGTSFRAAILGLSAHVTEDEKQLSAMADMEEIFSKPLLSDQAIKLLKQYMSVSISK